ncbi:MAG: hypothetical protein RLZZ609_460 [Cyanobacteriota bacterium]|jgi:hypothetical protein
MGGSRFSRAGRPTLTRLAIAAAVVLSHSLAKAQLSPNCQRNGQHDCCALTPVAGATTNQQAVDKITFADHTVYEVLRNETSCKNASATVRTCNAKITAIGRSGSIPAFYRGTAYEGGYKHEYVGRGIHLTYFYLD